MMFTQILDTAATVYGVLAADPSFHEKRLPANRRGPQPSRPDPA